MTCIVALVQDDAVWMAGDSGQFRGWNVHTMAEGKIYRHGGCLFGSAGYSRFRQLVKYHLELPDLQVNQDLEDWAVADLVPRLRHVLKDAGHARIDNGQDKHDNDLLIGVAGTIVEVAGDYAVTVHHDMAAVGCGAEFALGSLHATRWFTHLDPERRLHMALEAANHFSAGVQPPFTFLKLDQRSLAELTNA